MRMHWAGRIRYGRGWMGAVHTAIHTSEEELSATSGSTVRTSQVTSGVTVEEASSSAAICRCGRELHAQPGRDGCLGGNAASVGNTEGGGRLARTES